MTRLQDGMASQCKKNATALVQSAEKRTFWTPWNPDNATTVLMLYLGDLLGHST